MNGTYAYTPYVWSMLVTAALLLVLGIYAWPRRIVPATIPFILLLFAWAIWALGSAFELAAVDPLTKWFWFQFQAPFKVLTVTFGLIFVLAYAGLDKWLTRTTLTLLLAFPCVIIPILIVTNPLHHLGWTAVSFDQHVVATSGPINWATVLYAGLLFLFQMAALVWLWFSAPLYRWPIALMIGAQTLGRVAFVAEALGFNPVAPFDQGLLFSLPIVLVYLLALFRFRFFDVVPVGRETAIERMANGVLILNAENRIVDFNRAARKLLALTRGASIGCLAVQALASYPDLARLLEQETVTSAEISLQGTDQPSCFLVQISPLTHRRGFKLGRLILLHDVTEQKQAREQLLLQQRALATLQERERLGRELHDNLGQVLGYLKLKLHVLREALVEEERTSVDRQLAQLEAVVQEAHTDIRDYLLGLDPKLMAQTGFLSALRDYLSRFGMTYQIQTDLQVSPEINDSTLDPIAQVQLRRIIQEALTNTRKHSGAHRACVSLQVLNERARIIVEDDGCGFDMKNAPQGTGQHYGLGFMRERAAEVGGSVEIDSAPGRGTRVVVDMPTSS